MYIVHMEDECPYKELLSTKAKGRCITALKLVNDKVKGSYANWMLTKL